MNALNDERMGFGLMTPFYRSDIDDFMINEDEQSFLSDGLRQHFKMFKEKAWKSFAEVNVFPKLFSLTPLATSEFFFIYSLQTNSLCTLLMTFFRPKFSEIDAPFDVLYTLKHSLDVYEQTLCFDIIYPGKSSQSKILKNSDSMKNNKIFCRQCRESITRFGER